MYLLKTLMRMRYSKDLCVDVPRREAAHVLKRPPVKYIDGSLSGYIFYIIGGTVGEAIKRGVTGRSPVPIK